LTNKVFYTFILIGALVLLAIGINAISHPNPGHIASEIEGGGITGIESVVTSSSCSTSSLQTATATCPAGKVPISGGCAVGAGTGGDLLRLRDSFPSPGNVLETYNRWSCRWERDGPVVGTYDCIAWAFCVDAP